MTETWIARDTAPILSGKPPCVCMFFGERPQLRDQGFWQQSTRFDGRYPAGHNFGLRPGELARVNLVIEKG